MSTDSTYAARAEAAASVIVARFADALADVGIPLTGRGGDTLRLVLAIAWLEGSGAGSGETLELVRAEMREAVARATP